jgi:hypothetical protein
MWILSFGVNGIVGLASVSGSLLIPVLCFSFRYPTRLWFTPKVAPAAVLAVCTTLFMLDSVLNNMYNPVFALVSGGLSGIAANPPESLMPKRTGPKIPRRRSMARRAPGRASPARSLHRQR